MIPASEIEAALAKKFAAPEYAFIPQMNQGTGAHAGRRADAVAFSLWPSRGLYLTGFEIKTHRGDWRNEVRTPEKADAIGRFCRHWYLVTGPDVVKPLDILPATWGHIVFDGRELSLPTRPADMEAQPLTIEIIAALFRGVTTAYVPKAEIDARVAERVKEIETRRNPDAQLRKKFAEVRRAMTAASHALWCAEEITNGRERGNGIEKYLEEKA